MTVKNVSLIALLALAGATGSSAANVHAGAAATTPPARLVVPCPASTGSDPQTTVTKVHRFNTTGYLAITKNPMNTFHVYNSNDEKCRVGGTTSKTATRHGCLLATNGGQFNTANDDCVGGVVSDNVTISTMENEFNKYALPAFGLSKQGEWVLGTDVKPSEYGNFNQLVAGFNWLVYNGSVSITKTSLSPREIAPRTFIGLGKNGELMNFVGEGSEFNFIGLNMQESAQWAADLGFYHALNLDGGGSTTMIFNGKTQGCPTCHDTWECCERSVTTVMCVKPSN